MRVVDITFTERESDDDIAMFIRTANGGLYTFIIPAGLMPHLTSNATAHIPSKPLITSSKPPDTAAVGQPHIS